MLKKHLILILMIFAFHVNYVANIRCYVCNSVVDKDCDQKSVPINYIKDCYQQSDERYHRFRKTLDEIIVTTNPDMDIGMTCELCDDYEKSGLRFSQCLKTTLSLKNGSKWTERVIRDCSGMHCKIRGCNKKNFDSGIKSESCLCDQDVCNSGHRRVHQNNFCTNCLLLALISVNILFNLIYGLL